MIFGKESYRHIPLGEREENLIKLYQPNFPHSPRAQIMKKSKPITSSVCLDFFPTRVCYSSALEVTKTSWPLMVKLVVAGVWSVVQLALFCRKPANKPASPNLGATDSNHWPRAHA